MGLSSYQVQVPPGDIFFVVVRHVHVFLVHLVLNELVGGSLNNSQTVLIHDICCCICFTCIRF